MELDNHAVASACNLVMMRKFDDSDDCDDSDDGDGYDDGGDDDDNDNEDDHDGKVDSEARLLWNSTTMMLLGLVILLRESLLL